MNLRRLSSILGTIASFMTLATAVALLSIQIQMRHDRTHLQSPEVSTGLLEAWKPLEVRLNAKDTVIVEFGLPQDAVISLEVVSECYPEYLIDGKRLYELPSIEGVEIGGDISSPLINQYPLDKGMHQLTIANNTEQECLAVVHLFDFTFYGSPSINLTIGANHGAILNPGEIDAYSLSIPTAPETITVRVSPDANTALQPVLRLYRPDGHLLATDVFDAEISSTIISRVRLEQSGRYVLTVQDWNHQHNGSYEITALEDSPLTIGMGEAAMVRLPYTGPHKWTVRVLPSDIVSGNVECIAYSLRINRPKPVVNPPSAPSEYDFQDRDPVYAEPGDIQVLVMNYSEEGGGDYIFGCQDVGEHRTVGIGGRFAFFGDYFTRYLPAISGHSAIFSLLTENGRIMQLDLWMDHKLIAHAMGSNPTFSVTFPKSGTYTLIGRPAPNTPMELVGQELLIDWIDEVLEFDDVRNVETIEERVIVLPNLKGVSQSEMQQEPTTVPTKTLSPTDGSTAGTLASAGGAEGKATSIADETTSISDTPGDTTRAAAGTQQDRLVIGGCLIGGAILMGLALAVIGRQSRRRNGTQQ